MFDGLKFANL